MQTLQIVRLKLMVKIARMQEIPIINKTSLRTNKFTYAQTRAHLKMKRITLMIQIKRLKLMVRMGNKTDCNGPM